jgi:hypothetical protein
MFNYRLRNFPVSAKALALGYLMALSLSYVYAIANIALVIGLSPKDIAIHYYGSDQKITTENPGEQSLDLNAPPAQPASLPQPSLKNIVTEGHFHLFGMTSFFFGLTILGLFTGVKERWKAIMVSGPYFAVVVDNLSFMATRFLGPKFAFLTAGAGTLMALSFCWLWVVIMLEIVKAKES